MLGTFQSQSHGGDCSSTIAATIAAIETLETHNRLVRDKTPLQYALQCFNLELAGHLLDRGVLPKT